MNPRTDANMTLAPEQEHLIDEQIAQLRAASELLDTPAIVETRLKAAFVRHHVDRRARKRWRDFIAHWFAPGFALAASVGMAAWMVFSPLARAPLDNAPSAAPAAGGNIGTDADAADLPFIALQSLEQIALEPHPRVIETDVPRMWLASYGVPVNPENAGGLMRAEMLVSASGQPLAMRFAH
ncbi:MAG: hypothetical protein ABL931_13455 [Usitatibacteraceae bacterium]